MDAAPARIAHYLDRIGAEAERRGEREWGVRLPSEKRGAIGAALSVRERTLTIRAFVLRGPDRAHEEVYRRLLRKNLAIAQWRFAIDDNGDVFLVCDAPLALLRGRRDVRERRQDRLRRARGHGVPPPAARVRGGSPRPR